MKPLLTGIILLLSNLIFAQDKLPTAAEIRQEISGQVSSLKIPPGPVAKTEDLLVPNGSNPIRVRLYYPDTGRKKHPVIYQIHGGALVAGDLDTHDNICRFLCRQTGSVVVAVDYRKAPEYPYPASINDCVAVLNWIQKTAGSWSGDLSQLTLLGDSGGGLLLTSLLVRGQHKIPVKKVVLINPAVDIRNVEGGLYELVTKMYLNGRSPDNYLISPLLAKDLSALPPTLVVTCGQDQLKPQGLAWYNRLKESKVPVKTVDIPNEDHLGPLWSAAHPKAKIAMDEAVNFIKATH